MTREGSPAVRTSGLQLMRDEKHRKSHFTLVSRHNSDVNTLSKLHLYIREERHLSDVIIIVDYYCWTFHLESDDVKCRAIGTLLRVSLDCTIFWESHDVYPLSRATTVIRLACLRLLTANKRECVPWSIIPSNSSSKTELRRSSLRSSRYLHGRRCVRFFYDKNEKKGKGRSIHIDRFFF